MSQETIPSTNASTRRAKVRSAVRAGAAGEARREGATRVERVAHGLASALIGKPAEKKARQNAEEYRAMVEARVAKAEAGAQEGSASRSVLNLLKRSERLPRGNARPNAATSSSMEGFYRTEHNRSGDETSTTWNVSQSYLINEGRFVKPRTSDRDYVGLRTPDGRTQPTISVTTPSGNTRQVSVDRVTFSYNAPTNSDGSEIGPGSTTVTINDRPYDPEAWGRLSKGNRGDSSYDNRLQFTVLPSGEMRDISVGRNNGVTMEAAREGTYIDPRPFLDEMSFLVDGAQPGAYMPQQPPEQLRVAA